ncbi:hypothetical protein [Spirosoma spitsbergense]|uniref:hypothetical protein n=1 Tax=Spirosoma spitsbergense TaxID=431554 RepID=UPI000377EBDF|nr:hypothetical protein [Spirosoma spitsbergense]
MAKQRQRLDSNTIISITATIVSVCALFLSVYQTMLSRQQQSTSVWPKLVISNAYFNDGDFYWLDIRNVGIGPAIIKDVTIEQAGKPYQSMNEYVTYALTTNAVKDSTFSLDYSELDVEDVIPQGEKKRLIDVKGKEATRLFLEKRKQFRLTVTYASIYGEEWTVQYGPFGKAASKK